MSHVPTLKAEAHRRRLRRHAATGGVAVAAVAGAVSLLVWLLPDHKATTVKVISPATTIVAPTPAAATQKIFYKGVGLIIPADWPVLDGAHKTYGCSSTFDGQTNRAFLGVSYQGVPSCPARPGDYTPPAADGVWMQPGESSPPDQSPTTLTGGQVVYLSNSPRASDVNVWYHGVSIHIGIGPNPAVERAILDSISYRPSAPDSAVLGRCPAPDPSPPVMPAPVRLTAPLIVDGNDGEMEPEPPSVQPRVGATTVWNSFFHDFGGFSGPLQWSMYFGSYSAQTPATINPNGSTTPQYQGVPAWLIQGEGVKTAYGPCGITVIAPYNADSGQGMGVETTG